MIEMQETVTCKYCHKPIVQGPGGHRARQYCNDAHKMRYRRAQQVKVQPTLEQQNIAALQERLSSAETHIEKLQLEMDRLQNFIDRLRDIEATFSTDTGVHAFKKWLKPHQYHAERPGCKKILDDAYGFPPAGSRGVYTDAMRRAGFTPGEESDVWSGWKAMLAAEMFKSYYANRDK